METACVKKKKKQKKKCRGEGEVVFWWLSLSFDTIHDIRSLLMACYRTVMPNTSLLTGFTGCLAEKAAVVFTLYGTN